MTIDLQEQARLAQVCGDFSLLLDSIPYARLIGVRCSRQGDDLIFCLPAIQGNVGNPLLPALHGGVIAGFMELSACLHLMIGMGTAQLPKIIDFSVDYLRAGLYRATYVQCQVWRQGRRVTNVGITAWQTTAAEPIATARAHFKIEDLQIE